MGTKVPLGPTKSSHLGDQNRKSQLKPGFAPLVFTRTLISPCLQVQLSALVLCATIRPVVITCTANHHSQHYYYNTCTTGRRTTSQSRVQNTEHSVFVSRGHRVLMSNQDSLVRCSSLYPVVGVNRGKHQYCIALGERERGRERQRGGGVNNPIKPELNAVCTRLLRLL